MLLYLPTPDKTPFPSTCPATGLGAHSPSQVPYRVNQRETGGGAFAGQGERPGGLRMLACLHQWALLLAVCFLQIPESTLWWAGGLRQAHFLQCDPAIPPLGIEPKDTKSLYQRGENAVQLQTEFCKTLFYTFINPAVKNVKLL